MREAVFVRQHAEAWAAFENRLDADAAVDPDALADGYVRLVDDLAYARTYYPTSPTTAYLNGLAGRVHQRLYRTRRVEPGRLVRFWTRDVPLAFFEARRPLAIAALFFAACVALGAASALTDGTFVRLILGDAYVNMTLENIAGGDPMAVYKQANEMDMTSMIALNNVLVSFFAFTGFVPVGGSGAVPGFSVGTLLALFRNGVMVGAFQAFFAREGLLWESARTIWIHGTLEIAAIVAAGGAGLSMGNALLFPGTYPRLVAFQRGARRGATMAMGLVPVFLVAALLEGFVTRHTAMPDALALAIIGASLVFVVGYGVVLPRRVGRAVAAEEAAAAARSDAALPVASAALTARPRVGA